MPPDAIRRDERFARRLPFRSPHDFATLMSFLATRALPGVEHVVDGSYTRAVAWDGGASTGWIVVTPHATKPFVSMTVSRDPGRFADDLAARARRLFDLETDPAAVNAALRRDPLLARHVKSHPGLRVPGAWDPFELSVRAILGQQVSVAAARTLAGRIVARWGIPLREASPHGLSHAFPDASRLVDSPLEEIGVVRARAEAVRTLARAVACGELDFTALGALDAAVDALTRLRGIGTWTAHVIAMRALRHADAFPAGDLGLRRALARGGALADTRALETRLSRVRPFRAYAAAHLWTIDARNEARRKKKVSR